MNIKQLTGVGDLINLVDAYTSFLHEKGVCFDSLGFPIPKKSWYLECWPEDIVTYDRRNASLIKDPKDTVICFYCPDKLIFPRLRNIFSDLSEYHKYLGVVGTDLTVTADMDLEWQREIILINQLFMAIVAVSGTKVVQNLRIGLPQTLNCLSSVPRDVMCASSTLGCHKTTNPLNVDYLAKVLSVGPSKTLIYGKHDPILEQQLDTAGVPYRLYRDIHTRYKCRDSHDYSR